VLATRRATIAREVELVGRGLHEGLETRLVLRPAEPGRGIAFVRSDAGGSARVPASIHSRADAPRRTLLQHGGAEVHTVEHLLAAVHACGITDLDISLDNAEVPGMDGSSAAFIEAIDRAGVRELDGDVPALRLDRVVAVEGPGGSRVVAHPWPGGLRLGYSLELPDELGAARVELDITPEAFRREVGPARTFCLEREAMALRAAGLGKGASTDNTLVIAADGLPIDNTLRYPDEYARHKLLDLFGDLALLGARLEARVVSYKGGHALNARLCAALARLLAEGAGGASGDARPASRPDDPALVTEPGAGGEPGGRGVRFTPPEEAFRGHFPGAPVLPGVVSLAALAEVACSMDAQEAGRRVTQVRSARFRQLVRPGKELVAEVALNGDNGARGSLWLETGTDTAASGVADASSMPPGRVAAVEADFELGPVGSDGQGAGAKP
jgi:UDP-3-O-[3-hydroxymyristoyl] N-acetylglucosamine deacetylase/3-hydroxyacyl-[acyl-carrier-protein] dehydratase